MKKNLTLIFSAFLCSMSLYAQNVEQVIEQYQKQQKAPLHEYKVVETIQDADFQRVYTQRVHNGLPVYNSYTTYLIKGNKVLSGKSSEHFSTDLSNLRNLSSTPSLTLEEIVAKIGQKEGLTVIPSTTTLAVSKKGIHFSKKEGDQLMYYIDQNNQAHLAYSFSFRKVTDEINEVFDAVVDARTAEVLEIHSQTLSCGFSHDSFNSPNAATFNKEEWAWLYDDAIVAKAAEPNYTIFKLPVESPNHGGRLFTPLTSTINSVASPEGWHTDDEKSYTVTRGNNVRAVNDHESIGYDTYNGSDAVTTDYVDGGSSLNFDFPVDFTKHPYKYKEASTTNLFYINNMMHDIFYNYGFTEANGNFQKTNYEKGGTGNDAVIALAQTGLSKGALNNAQFGTPPDGSAPIMLMYLWNPPAGSISFPLTINSPSNIANDYAGIAASFGPAVPDTPITSDFALVKKNETTGTPYDGCGTISNASEINNKIAVILRGDCTFPVKVKAAQNAGAKAVVVVNNVNGTMSMGGSDTSITIPSIGINNYEGNLIIAELEKKNIVNGTLKAIDIPYKDGSFDNGIVAHEYGHGISNRLTGPLNNASCLNNNEQMGEGWSDFFALMITQLPNDVATTSRGMGTFAVNQAISGRGIRPTPYTTNMSVNPSTYASLKNYPENDSPHNTGYVWATMLWDLNWKMINKYGFSPDLYNGKAGNNIALNLVMHGLKLQTCRPGFVDGRDAILAADEILNNGENKCDIWETFARRGLGYSADQGSSSLRRDGTAAYDLPGECKLSTSDLAQNSTLQIYPNPAKDVVFIVDKTLKGEILAELIDVTGRTVSKEKVSFSNTKTSISTQHLGSGIYILKLHTQNGVITKKVIKK